jgi:subtilisin family serine protease
MFPIDPKPVSKSSQVTVALVDTPIQPLGGKMNEFVLPSMHVTSAPDSLPADPTHATSMAQTILSSMALAKDSAGDANLGTVRVQPIDIYGNSPTTTTFEVAQGLYKAIQSEAQVINLSLGGTGESPMVDYLLEMAKKKQIMVFASAGNSPTTDPTWPAASPNALAVTATDWSGNIAPYANRGSFIDLKAPGSNRIYHNGQVYISTGTSTATAFVSGQAAALTARGLAPLDASAAIQKAFDVNQPAVERVPRR